MNRFFLLLVFMCLSFSTIQAQLNLAGVVTDEHEQPLGGAIIRIRGTTDSTTTQEDGQFSLQTTSELPFMVSVSRAGYRPKDVQVRGNNFRNIIVRLRERAVVRDTLAIEFVEAVSRLPEDIQKAGVTVEKLTENQVRSSATISPFDALQYAKGVDFLTQSLLFKSVTTRGFGSTTNSRFLQLNDGIDNRSPGLGFGFGNVAGIPDLDVESIELVPGASSALYGPDAEQGLMSTKSKNPFDYQGLSARITGGANNVGKPGFSPKPYTDFALRYASELNDRLAFKLNLQRTDATDFIADNYNDRQTRDRANGLNYIPNNHPNTNFEYDGVNIYGDEMSGTGSAYTFPKNYANLLLQNKLVTRTGYAEADLIGKNGKVFNTRANASLHYKLPGNIEASVGWYYGNGNFIRTANFREYFPNYQRQQIKAELRGEHFFLRAYTTQQKAEGWNMGLTATAINNGWKSLGQWAAEFGQAYVENKVTVGESRATADRNRFLPGSTQFNNVHDAFTITYNTDSVPGYGSVRGTRFRDNSALWQYEGMYSFMDLFGIADIMVGGNVRHYALNTGGTLFALKPDRSEYGINEYGAYVQAAKEITPGSAIIIKPTLALRYDKNQYVAGVFSPKASLVLSVGQHNFRGSWQSAFHSPVPGQLFAVPGAGRSGEVGALPFATQAAGLGVNLAYSDTDVKEFLAGRLTDVQLKSRPFLPTPIQVEQLNTWEVGYKTIIQNRLSIDALYFQSHYTHFLTTRTVYQPTNGQLTDFATNAYRTLQVNLNSTNDMFVTGWAIGAEYKLVRGFSLSGNYAHQIGTVTVRDAQGNIVTDNSGVAIVKRRMSNPEVARLGRNYFNSPENRYTLALSNPHLTDRLGANLAYHWTDRMWYEQGTTAGDVWVPAWASLDAQVSYKMPALKSVVKIGGTNILNNYYAQGYGLAQIGGLYYVSLMFDELMR